MLEMVAEVPTRQERERERQLALAGMIEPMFRLETFLWRMWPVLMWYSGTLFK